MKRRGTVGFALSLVVLVLLCYVALFGVSFGVREIRPFTAQMEDRMDLGYTGGYYGLYKAEAESVSHEQMREIWAMLRKRADDAGLTEAVILLEDNEIRIEFSATEKKADDVLSLFEGAGEMVWKDHSGKVVMTAEDFDTVQVGTAENSYVIGFTLTEEGAKQFEEVTAANVGSKLSVLLDGQEISTPSISSVIKGNTAYFSTGYTLDKTLAVVAKINNPTSVSMTKTESGLITATMGENTLSAAYKIFAVTLVAAGAALIGLYKGRGMMGALALVWQCLLLPFVVLTIPGVFLSGSGLIGMIASFLLSFASIVLLLQNVKMEGKLVNDALLAFDNGFKRTVPTVLDGTILLILFAGILSLFATGAIREFGSTLCLGACVNAFISLVVARLLIRRSAGRASVKA